LWGEQCSLILWVHIIMYIYNLGAVYDYIILMLCRAWILTVKNREAILLWSQHFLKKILRFAKMPNYLIVEWLELLEQLLFFCTVPMLWAIFIVSEGAFLEQSTVHVCMYFQYFFSLVLDFYYVFFLRQLRQLHF